MQERHRNRELYFKEQTQSTRQFVIPYIQSVKDIDDRSVVLEIGCGEGGNLQPFFDLGCTCYGIDLDENKINIGKSMFEEQPDHEKIHLIYKDIYNIDPSELPKFDLIFLRDVIEHIHDQKRFLGFMKRFLKDDGVVFFAFPPWRMPFGGHQQILENKFLSKLPYYHILPKGMYRRMLKAGGTPEGRIESLMEIKDTRISIARFKKIIKENGYVFLKETDYLINPNYQVKFNLKPRKLYVLNKVPFFRDFFTTCFYCVVGKNDIHSR